MKKISAALLAPLFLALPAIAAETPIVPGFVEETKTSGIDSVYAPPAHRVTAWGRLATELAPELVERNTRVIGLSEALAVAPELLAGKVRGRVVVDVHR